ncbi:hypothetical protein MKZ38_008825 [Zalerion maritima]|uniref:Uncharacterized protein n=1 Tax=Zalerion maritima TaxID=339359 RepID=A0AAD5RU07_9PEZI|nr:hypothetical protein MKZ38_008825 [Zalerion maritima]
MALNLILWSPFCLLDLRTPPQFGHYTQAVAQATEDAFATHSRHTILKPNVLLANGLPIVPNPTPVEPQLSMLSNSSMRLVALAVIQRLQVHVKIAVRVRAAFAGAETRRGVHANSYATRQAPCQLRWHPRRVICTTPARHTTLTKVLSGLVLALSRVHPEALGQPRASTGAAWDAHDLTSHTSQVLGIWGRLDSLPSFPSTGLCACVFLIWSYHEVNDLIHDNSASFVEVGHEAIRRMSSTQSGTESGPMGEVPVTKGRARHGQLGKAKKGFVAVGSCWARLWGKFEIIGPLMKLREGEKLRSYWPSRIPMEESIIQATENITIASGKDDDPEHQEEMPIMKEKEFLL